MDAYFEELCDYTGTWKFDVEIKPYWEPDNQKYDYVVEVKATRKHLFTRKIKVIYLFWCQVTNHYKW